MPAPLEVEQFLGRAVAELEAGGWAELGQGEAG